MEVARLIGLNQVIISLSHGTKTVYNESIAGALANYYHKFQIPLTGFVNLYFIFSFCQMSKRRRENGQFSTPSDKCGSYEKLASRYVFKLCRQTNKWLNYTAFAQSHITCDQFFFFTYTFLARRTATEFLTLAFKSHGPCKNHLSFDSVAKRLGIYKDTTNERSGSTRLGFEMRYMSLLCVFRFS